MTEGLNDKDLEAMERAALEAQVTAENEVLLSEAAKTQALKRKPFIEAVSGRIDQIRTRNHFGEDYELTMFVKRKRA